MPSVLSVIERIARDPTIDIDRLERMLAFQERLMQQQAEVEFNEAMARLQARLANVRITKTKSVLYDVDRTDKRKGQAEAFRYAPLDEIDKVLRPLLVEEGVVLSDTTELREGGGIVHTTRATHRNGKWREASIPLPYDTTGGKSNIQAVGSSTSYGRRYCRCLLFNVITMDDDDGTGGPLSETQIAEILALMKTARVGPRFLKLMRAQSVEEAGSVEAAVATIPGRKYRDAIVTLQEQIAKNVGDQPKE